MCSPDRRSATGTDPHDRGGPRVSRATLPPRGADPRERVALFRYLPQLAARVPWASLGDWPTPLTEARVEGAPLWIKREGDSSPLYGGNKVRTLEAWLGHVRAAGAERVWAIGAYGSNHAVATVLHARAIGLDAGVIVFPQPACDTAIENAAALLASRCPLVRLHNVVEVPFAGVAVAARDRWESAPHAHLAASVAELARWTRPLIARVLGDQEARRSLVMPPGGATPVGTFGALSAVFELAEQIADGVAPPPRRIVLPAGSTCTSAGLLAGFALADALGVWRWPVPIVHAVRVTPWPVTSRLAITLLASRTLARVAALGGPRVELGAVPLVVDGKELGRGYGQITPRAREVMQLLATDAMPRLDGVYSGKAAAALLRLHRAHEGPLLFWSTKSSVVLDAAAPDAIAHAPRALREWMAR